MTLPAPRRLCAQTLGDVQAWPRPDYDRTAPPAIAHIGVGAFARAHLAVYADELLRRGRPALIRGVSLNSRRAEDQLEPQDGLFTVAVREPGEDLALRVVGAVASVRTGPTAALEALTDPATRLVTLTITEKGYAALDEEPSTVTRVVSAPALIARALQRRRQAGLRPPIFASLDNLLDNGSILRTRVLHEADTFDSTLTQWIAEHVRFPSSVVDRMVPAATERDLEEIAGALHVRDEAAVVAERHRSWIIRSVEGLDSLGEVGVELVADVAPFERRKLWLLNGPHSAVAYAGLLAGVVTIAGALEDPAIAGFVRGLVDDTLEVAGLPTELRPAAFAAEALHRFANPALGHTCAQVGADGSSKLPQRLLPVVTARGQRALHTARFAVAAAIWLAAAGGVRVRGARLPLLQDPMAAALRAAARRPDGLQALSRMAFGESLFAVEVTAMLERVTKEGLSLLGAVR